MNKNEQRFRREAVFPQWRTLLGADDQHERPLHGTFCPLASYFDSPVIFEHNDGRQFMGWLSRFFDTKDSAKVEIPATAFAKPLDVVRDSTLSKTEKVEALDTWEQDARQLMTASNEGMPGPREGLDPDDHHQMGQVLRAKEKVGRMPNYKSAH